MTPRPESSCPQDEALGLMGMLAVRGQARGDPFPPAVDQERASPYRPSSDRRRPAVALPRRLGGASSKPRQERTWERVAEGGEGAENETEQRRGRRRRLDPAGR